MGLYILLQNKILLPPIVYFFFMWSIWQVHSTKNYLNQTTIFCHVLRISIWLQFHAINSLSVFSSHMDKWLRSENEGRNKKKKKNFLGCPVKLQTNPHTKPTKIPQFLTSCFGCTTFPDTMHSNTLTFSVWFWDSSKGTNDSQLHVC